MNLKPKLRPWYNASKNKTLLEQASQIKTNNINAVSKLRKFANAETVHAAISIMHNRNKHAAKLGAWAENWMGDNDMTQQASSFASAQWKAQAAKQRLKNHSENIWLDLGCAAGADSLALGQAGFHVNACDIDPVRVWCARQNKYMLEPTQQQRVEFHIADAAKQDIQGKWLHIDPARRQQNSRLQLWQDMIPAPDVWMTWVKQARGACIKLSPSSQWDDLENAMQHIEQPCSISFIYERNSLTQCILWTGELADTAQPRQAIYIQNDGKILTQEGEPSAPYPIFETTDSLNYLYEPHPALERSQLLGAHYDQCNIKELHPGLGIGCTQDTQACHSPWHQTYSIDAICTPQTKSLQKKLTELGTSWVEVKTRGQACKPDALQKQLSKKNDHPKRVLYYLRLGKKIQVFICQRHTPATQI